MKKWRIIKYVLLAILLVIVGTASFVAYQVYDRFCWFGLEDMVVHHYEGVIDSIEEYIKEKQKFPETLLAAVSEEEMSHIIEMKEILRTNYYVIPERQAWKLDVLVRARGIERQFVYVSDGKLTEEEENRYYIWCHDWVVLRMP